MSRWLLLFLFITPSAAAKEPYGLALVDELKALDRPGLEQAAAPLVKRGAAVAVVLVRHGGQPDAVKHLAQLGLLDHKQIVPAGLYIYVSLDPRYSELRAGPDWSALTPSILDEIRGQVLNPALRQGQYQSAGEDSLRAMEARLAGGHWLKTIFMVLAAAVCFQLIIGIEGHTPLGRALSRLWNLTPMGRRQQRLARQRELEYRLRALGWEANSLKQALESARALSSGERSRVEGLLAQLDRPDTEKLSELTTQARKETAALAEWNATWNGANRVWVEASTFFRKLRSQLKERKKTRDLLQSPEFLDLQERFTAEEATINGLLQAGATPKELQKARARWRTLHDQVKKLWNRYFPKLAISSSTPARPANEYYDSSSSDYSPTPSSSSSSSYEPSYEPPSAPASESWSGGDW